MNKSLHNNIRNIYLLGFFNSFMVINPVFVPLLQGHDLSMNQVLQTQALFALTIALFLVASLYHMRLGMQTIIEDYMHGEGGKLALLVANTFFTVIIGALCLFALLKLAFGG